jgi:hypothetical protein
MDDILLNVIAILTVTVIFGVFYIIMNPHMTEKILLPSMDDADDELIRKCIKDAFLMTEMINASTSPAELESYYWEVETLEDSYRGFVPDALLSQHTERLYDAISIRRDIIKAIKVAS